MHKRDFAKHFEVAGVDILNQISELPDNARVSRVTVRDVSGFVSVPDNKKKWHEAIHVTATVKMDLQSSTLVNETGIIVPSSGRRLR